MLPEDLGSLLRECHQSCHYFGKSQFKGSLVALSYYQKIGYIKNFIRCLRDLIYMALLGNQIELNKYYVPPHF